MTIRSKCNSYTIKVATSFAFAVFKKKHNNFIHSWWLKSNFPSGNFILISGSDDNSNKGKNKHPPSCLILALISWSILVKNSPPQRLKALEKRNYGQIRVLASFGFEDPQVSCYSLFTGHWGVLIKMIKRWGLNRLFSRD